MSKLKLEVGKSYVDGYGEIVAIVVKLGGVDYDPYVSSQGDRYSEDGRSGEEYDGSKRGLLREVSPNKVEDGIVTKKATITLDESELTTLKTAIASFRLGLQINAVDDEILSMVRSVEGILHTATII